MPFKLCYSEIILTINGTIFLATQYNGYIAYGLFLELSDDIWW